jgi:TPR repeat protein
VPPAPVGPTQNRDEIAALVARGAKYFAAGDVAAARLVLRPAAVAGDSGAALALGETYDPLMLKRLGVIGFAGDLAEARDWYRRAAELGSADAPQRLDQLAGLDR